MALGAEGTLRTNLSEMHDRVYGAHLSHLVEHQDIRTHSWYISPLMTFCLFIWLLLHVWET